MVIFSILAFYLDQPHMQMDLKIPPSFFFFTQAKWFFHYFLNTMLYFRISQKITLVNMALRYDWGHCMLFYQLTVHYIVLKELYYRKFWKKYFYPFLQISILKNIQ